MNAAAFLRLPAEHQLALVFDTGTWLAARWEAPRFVLVYTLPDGLVAEVAYDTAAGRVVLLRCDEEAAVMHAAVRRGAAHAGFSAAA